MWFLLLVRYYNRFKHKAVISKKNFFRYEIRKTTLIQNFFHTNAFIWQEGLLLDFLQKKSTDVFVKKFFINTAYLFNERLVFEKIFRFYLDFFISLSQKLSVFELNNVTNLLFITIYFFLFFFIFFTLFFILMV